jgi:hypothetical protein
MVSAAVQPEVWTFDPATHTYTVNGQVVPSVTQVIRNAGLINFDMVKPDILERKALLGKLVHQACHYYDENDLPEELPEEVVERLESYKLFRTETGYKPDCNEVRMIASIHGMKFGMQFDSIGMLHGRLTLVDLKTGADEHPAWGVQTAAYELGLKHTVKYQRIAVQLKPERKYKVHSYNDPGDAQIFIACLAIANWKRNKRLS